jgi:serine/threonine-protein kinase
MSETDLPKAGDLIGVRYRIETLLGQGGMGAVFAAVNQATGRAVAIKWMLPGAARSKESLMRFLAEARATAKIEHPNVIQILDVGQDGEAPFLVMERLRGSSLAERLEKGGRLPTPEALRVMIPACKGVAEAHAEGIIHRDLKPDNIFLCEGKDGSPRPPKVLDFGISKLFDDDAVAGGSPMTRTGIAMGTPWYMSPEQLNAAGEPDARYDVYAMGVVLYECLAGRPPYNAEGLFELVQQIAAGNPTPIRAYAPDVPPDLEASAMRAMHRDRTVRPPTMNAFAAELEQIQQRLASGAPAQYAPIPSTGAQMMTPAPHATPPHGGPTGPMGGQWTPAGQSYGAPPSGPVYPGSGPVSHPTMARPASGGGGGKGLLIGGAVALLGLGLLGVIGIVGALVFIGRSSTDSGGGGTSSPIGGGGGILDPVVGGTSANPRDPNIEVTFSGTCNPRWDARRMVTGGPDSINVMSSGMGGLTGSIMLSYHGPTGEVPISTQNRMDTQTAINVMVGQQIWTNMTMDVTAVQRGRIPDPVSGSMTVTSFDSDLATMDVTFHNVTLQNMRDGSICTMNGRVRTSGTTYGM